MKAELCFKQFMNISCELTVFYLLLCLGEVVDEVVSVFRGRTLLISRAARGAVQISIYPYLYTFKRALKTRMKLNIINYQPALTIKGEKSNILSSEVYVN